MSYHINALLTDLQGTKLCDIKDVSELNISELTRRIFDYALQEHRMNEIIPSMSGRLKNICEKV